MECPSNHYYFDFNSSFDDDFILEDVAIAAGIVLGSVVFVDGGYFANTMLFKAGNTIVGKPTGHVPSKAMHDGASVVHNPVAENPMRPKARLPGAT